MANKLATITYSLQYTDSDNASKTVTVSTTIPYQPQNCGSIDVVDTTAASTEYDVPFGAVDNALGVVVINGTGQDLDVKVNASADVCYTIPANGFYVAQALSDSGATGTVTAVKLITTDTQSGEGLIGYKVFGDPT